MSTPSPTNSAESGDTGTVVYTLCEPNYITGAAALLNSLVAAGFRGLFVVGLKGTANGWLLNPNRGLPAGVRVELVPVDSPRHLAHLKPRFGLRVLDELAPASRAAIYLDPDIVLRATWPEFEQRCLPHGAVCADQSTPPWIETPQPWLDFAAAATGRAVPVTGLYINSGFVAVPRASRPLLAVWDALIEGCVARGFDASSFTWNGKRDWPFFFVDQDMLNLALRVAGTPVWIGGPETMDFAPGGNFLSHAISTPKPWDRWYLPRALARRKLRRCDIAFWNHVAQPIPAVPFISRTLHQIDLRLARLIAPRETA